MPVSTNLRRLLVLSLAASAACLVGCDADEAVRVYAAPKDAAPLPPAPRAKAVDWTLPPGWRQLPDAGPGQFGRIATIQVAADDPTLTLAVNELQGGGSGELLPNLNRWKASSACRRPPPPRRRRRRE
jgi:hypothetical protein